MKLLVLDSSGLVASVALLEDDRLIAEYTTGNKLTHSQTLLPMLDEVIRRMSFNMDEIDAVFYRTANRGSNSQGAWTGSEQTDHWGPNSGWTCISAVWCEQSDLSDDGCKKETSVYRILSIPRISDGGCERTVRPECRGYIKTAERV